MPLSQLLPILRDRFAGRGMTEGKPPGPCATFPGLHPGIRGVSVYDDGHELTVVVDDLTHGHFAVYDDAVPTAERERQIVDEVVEFLDDLFADRVAVWGKQNVGGGWSTIGRASPADLHDGQAFVWSGPLGQRPAEQ